jgi:hypothetical protein
MYKNNQADNLRDYGFDPSLVDKIKSNTPKPLFAIYYYLQLFLFAGVTCIASGLSMLLYQHIDDIGHTALIILTWVLCFISYGFCWIKRMPFNKKRQVIHPLIYFDYILLFGALLLTGAFAYTQYQMGWLGSNWSATILLPCLILFISAYFFDQTTLLTMAIVLLGSWLGLQVAPYQLIADGQFSQLNAVIAALLLGLFLIGIFFLTQQLQIKLHFEFTYINFALHILFIATINALFFIKPELIWWLLGALFTAIVIWYAFYKSSFYFLLCGFIYGYFFLSYAVVRLCFIITDSSLSIYLLLIYFIASGIMLISYLRKFKQLIYAAAIR